MTPGARQGRLTLGADNPGCWPDMYDDQEMQAGETNPGWALGLVQFMRTNCSDFRAHRAADPGVRSPMTISPDTEAIWSTPIDHPLDGHGHGGVTSGKRESQISVAVNNRPVAGAPLPVQYETSCGLLRLTV
jgi:hypothetical protein